MTFPTTPLVALFELKLGGVWTDITQYVYTRDQTKITRGRADEGGETAPSTASFTLNNRDGRFSPRNPMGAYYGLIGRNTPVRISVNLGTTRLVISDTSTDYAVTTDSAPLSITGDIDLRADVSFLTYDRADTVLVGKYYTGTADRSYSFTVVGGYLRLQWSTTGASWNGSAFSSVPFRLLTGRQAFRATLDVNNGAGGWTVNFYTSDTMSGTWSALGNPVTGVGVTSIYDSVAAAFAGFGGADGHYNSVKILSGIGGTEVANPDFTARTNGATSFVDAAANTWSLSGTAQITNLRHRFSGEISSWPVSWEVDQRDIYCTVEGAGVLRRYAQGASPLRSAFYRAVTGRAASVVAYWPCEDEDGATGLASGLTGGTPLLFNGTPTLATSDSFVASDPLPTLSNALVAGNVPTYTGTGSVQLRFLLGVPVGGTSSNAVLARLYTSGTAARWDLVYTTGGGNLDLRVYDAAGTLITSTGPYALGVDGFAQRISIELAQNGSNIDMNVLVLDVGAGSGIQTGVLSVASRTLGVAKQVVFDPGKNVDGVTLGHVTVQSVITSIFDLDDALGAYVGEGAGARVLRLLQEEGGDFASGGDYGSSTAMGVQTSQTLLDLIGECVDADMAVLSEWRDALALVFRPRDTVYTQWPTLAISYNDLNDLAPVDDDQSVRNDITVSRTGGSSARSTLETGSLSTLSPPNGVGRYDDGVTLNVQADSTLADQASWRLHLGTVDETRFPVVNIDLTATTFRNSQALTAAALDLDQGDLIVISGPPTFAGSPDDIRQIVQGATETFDLYSYEIAANCTPASVWDVGVYEATGSRYSSDGSTLGAGYTSSATSISVVTASGPLWSHIDGDFLITVAGEDMTVTNVTGSTSPQTFTVTRAVNGVIKAQLSGAVVALARPAYYAL